MAVLSRMQQDVLDTKTLIEALGKNMNAHSATNGGNFPRGEAKGT